MGGGGRSGARDWANRNRQQKPLQNPCGASRVAAAYSMDTLQLYMPNQLVSARQDVQYNARYDVCMRLERQGVRLTNAIGLLVYALINLKTYYLANLG